ncbi:MAG: hypothetical protein HYX76_10070 [Acidobacteria bacterium]|nr:hypothetical protein [Acidobacteriota bacterium]
MASLAALGAGGPRGRVGAQLPHPATPSPEQPTQASKDREPPANSDEQGLRDALAAYAAAFTREDLPTIRRYDRTVGDSAARQLLKRFQTSADHHLDIAIDRVEMTPWRGGPTKKRWGRYRMIIEPPTARVHGTLTARYTPEGASSATVEGPRRVVLDMAYRSTDWVIRRKEF